MLNWCVLNQCFVKSLSAQMLVHFLKFMALIRTKDCAVFYYYSLICAKVCAVFFMIMALICTKVCAIFMFMALMHT